jgi:hypothetical protein
MIYDALGQKKKHRVMSDTWGHLYPEPGTKHYGEMVIAIGEYGDCIIVTSDFPGLGGSPQRCALEHTIFNHITADPGVYRIKCGMWFFKTSNDMYLGERIGRLINIQIGKVQ